MDQTEKTVYGGGRAGRNKNACNDGAAHAGEIGFPRVLIGL
jgi:hypothetical protein